MLTVFGGLPGSGKTTLASRLAKSLNAVYLRIDTIEQAIKEALHLSADVGEAGYRVAYAVAADNLKSGLSVVADSVNPLIITRDAWCSVGSAFGIKVVEIEVTCSDVDEHKRRIESRIAANSATNLITWQQVVEREYDPWNRDRIVLDTAMRSVDKSFSDLMERIVPSRIRQ